MVCLHQGDQSPFYCLFSFNIVLKKTPITLLFRRIVERVKIVSWDMVMSIISQHLRRLGN